VKKTILILLFMLAALPSFAECFVSTLVLERNFIYPDERAEVAVAGNCSDDGAIPVRPIVRVEGMKVLIDFVFGSPGVQVPTAWGQRVRLPRLFPGSPYLTPYTVEARTGPSTKRVNLYVRERTFRVTPDSGSPATEVVIEGVSTDECESFGCDLKVFFGNTQASGVRDLHDGRIIAVVPPGSGIVDVRVVMPPATVTQKDGFTYGFFEDFERVLFPVNFTGGGANGSEWRTDIRLRNDGPIAVETEPGFYVDASTPTLPIPLPTFPAGGSARFPMVTRDGGAFMHVPLGQEKQFSYAARIVDLSRTTTDLGAEMPVVRAGDTTHTIRLLDVPVESRYRGRLRIYNFDMEKRTHAHVTITDPDHDDAVLAFRSLMVSGGPALEPCDFGPCLWAAPAFAVLDLDQLSQVQGHQRVDVTIEATHEARLWAFVSVTNNETQHVTLYTPQHRTRPQ
jgi:hypothetical protein